MLLNEARNSKMKMKKLATEYRSERVGVRAAYRIQQKHWDDWSFVSQSYDMVSLSRNHIGHGCTRKISC